MVRSEEVLGSDLHVRDGRMKDGVVAYSCYSFVRRDFDSFDPFLKGIVTPDQYSQVLGGQVFLWTEGTSESGMDGRIWPRAAAAAELWWTGAEPGSYPMSE